MHGSRKARPRIPVCKRPPYARRGWNGSSPSRPPADAGTARTSTGWLDQLRPEDVVIVWKLDRLSRSLKDLLHIMERIAQAGAGFRSLTEAIDTTTPAGRMLMQMVGSFAEFERAMIRERT